MTKRSCQGRAARCSQEWNRAMRERRPIGGRGQMPRDVRRSMPMPLRAEMEEAARRRWSSVMGGRGGFGYNRGI